MFVCIPLCTPSFSIYNPLLKLYGIISNCTIWVIKVNAMYPVNSVFPSKYCDQWELQVGSQTPECFCVMSCHHDSHTRHKWLLVTCCTTVCANLNISFGVMSFRMYRQITMCNVSKRLQLLFCDSIYCPTITNNKLQVATIGSFIFTVHIAFPLKSVHAKLHD